MNTEQLETRLEDELRTIEAELEKLGRKNPTNPLDYIADAGDIDILPADLNENADLFEEQINNNAALNDIEIRRRDVKSALAKMAEGAYGVCETGGEMIEPERLEADPAARTCIAHMNSPL